MNKEDIQKLENFKLDIEKHTEKFGDDVGLILTTSLERDIPHEVSRLFAYFQKNGILERSINQELLINKEFRWDSLNIETSPLPYSCDTLYIFFISKGSFGDMIQGTETLNDLSIDIVRFTKLYKKCYKLFT